MVLAVILLFVFSFMLAQQRDDLKVEAVQRGFAEWVVDVNGNTSFKWGEKTSL
jgi:hypothetical protein